MRTPLILLAVAIVAAGCADDGADAGADAPTTTLAGPTAETSLETQDSPDSPDSSDSPDSPDSPDSSVVPVTEASSALSADEIAGLLWMREEEQLAHDVYAELGARWDLPVFENIAASEQQHIEATIALLDRYGIDDPAAGNAPGTFTDPDIQRLYDDFVAEGSTSATDALTVGATIEELDIADLRARAAATDETAVVDVYRRLERASRNHLRAFVRQLDRRGEVYEPTQLEDFDAIVDGPTERGPDA